MSAATIFLSELATLFSCDRVCLGFFASKKMRIAAISQHFQRVEQSVLPEVTAAMEEAVLQGISLVYPQPAGTFPHITLAHSELARRTGLSRILTIPLAKDGQLIGALTLESRHGVAFDPECISFLEKLAVDVGPALEFKWRLQQPLWSRGMAAIRGGMAALREKSSRRYRITIALILAASVVALVAIPVPNNVTGQARLEASIQRVISAPIDGYLKEVHVRPGDRVKANQVLAELNDDALRAQRRQLEAEAAQQENALADAMVKNDRSQAATSRSKLDETIAQLDLTDQQLTHTRLVAPFDGVVIKGDLSQLLDAPLKRSDALLTLSQGQDFRVIVEIDERDIGDVRIGNTGTLALAAFPEERFSIRVVRITPLATTVAGYNAFEVEAVIETTASKLMPGLKGVAKIETNNQPAAWKWIARFWHSLTYMVWSRLG